MPEPHQASRFATPVLNFTAAQVLELAGQLAEGAPDPRAYVQRAHQHLDEHLGTIYSLDQRQPAGATLRRGAGSCEQRTACLEALARARGVPTRVRGLWLDRSFWAHRLPLLQPLMPRRMLVPWPQFFLDGAWVDLDELYGPIERLAAHATHPFTNQGPSLFSAVRTVAVDLLGKLEGTPLAAFSLARLVVGDEGLFDTRDDLLQRFLPHPGAVGTLLFNALYGGRPVRRREEA
ncbi:MAG TPA: transglutaminase-like domain-containing protein [Myxococcales bacterium]|jgi:hypothetical protein|nr:transglutaminase-like domain-containing protein [Myxococcales bacterium]